MTTLLNGHDYNDDVMVGTNGKAYDDPPPWAAASDPRPAFPDWFIADLMATVGGLGGGGVTSHSSVLVGTGSKAFVLDTASSLVADVYLVYDASTPTPTNGVYGTLAADTSASTALTLTNCIPFGSGTPSTWVIIPAGNLARRGINDEASTYTIALSDHRAVVVFTGSSPATHTLTALATLLPGFEFFAVNAGSASLTIARGSTDTIFGPGGSSTSIALDVGQAVMLFGHSTSQWVLPSATGYGASNPASAVVASLLFM